MTPFKKWCELFGYDPDGVFTVAYITPGDKGSSVGDKLTLVMDDGSHRPLFRGFPMACNTVAPIHLLSLTQNKPELEPTKPMSKEELVAFLKESLFLKMKFDGEYLEVSVLIDEEEICSDFVSLPIKRE